MRPKDKTPSYPPVTIRRSKTHQPKPEPKSDYGRIVITRYFGEGISIGEFKIIFQRYKGNQLRCHIDGPMEPQVKRLEMDAVLSLPANSEAYRRARGQHG